MSNFALDTVLIGVNWFDALTKGTKDHVDMNYQGKAGRSLNCASAVAWTAIVRFTAWLAPVRTGELIGTLGTW